MGVHYHGGYHEYCWGYYPLYIEYRVGHHNMCGGYHEYRGGVQYHGDTQITKDFPHGTHDIPHVHHDIPPGPEHALRYSR